MIRAFLAFLAVGVLIGCATDPRADLVREYGHFRYEQETYRAEDLEKLYREERRRSDELTEKILLLRAEIEQKEKEVGDLQKRLDEIDGER